LGFNLQPKHATANCSQNVSPMLPLGEYKREAIPPFTKLFWSTLLFLLLSYG